MTSAIKTRAASLLGAGLLLAAAMSEAAAQAPSIEPIPHDRGLLERARQFEAPRSWDGQMPVLEHKTVPIPAPYIAPRYAPPSDMKESESTDLRYTTPLYQPGFVHENFRAPAYTSPIIHERGRGYAGPICASPAVYPFAFGEYGGFGVTYFPYKSTIGSTQRYPFDGVNTYGPYVHPPVHAANYPDARPKHYGGAN